MAVDQLIRSRADQLWRLAPREPEEILLFGSYARGESRQDSDIDFLVILKPDTTRAEKDLYARAIRPLSEGTTPRLDVMPRTWSEIRDELMRRAPRTARRALAAAQLVLPAGRPSRIIPLGQSAVRHGRFRWVAGDLGLSVAYGNLVASRSCLGQYDSDAKSIVIEEESDDAGAAMALVHELGHFALHPYAGSAVAPACQVHGDDHDVVDNASELVCRAIGIGSYRSYMSGRGRQYSQLGDLDAALQGCVRSVGELLMRRYETTADPPFQRRA